MIQTPPLANESTTGFVPYDVAEYLRTPEEMAAYLEAWLEEAPDDVADLARALGDIARAKGMTQVASAEGNPSFSTVLKVIKALGLRLHASAMAAEG